MTDRGIDSDLDLLRRWDAPDERWRLFWLFPVAGFNGQDLKDAAVDVGEVYEATDASRRNARQASRRLSEELDPLRVLCSREQGLDWYVQWSGDDSTEAGVELGDALSKLHGHLMESTRRAVEHRRRAAAAEERFEPLRQERAELRDIEKNARQLADSTENLVETTGRLAAEAAEFDAEKSRIRRNLRHVHRVVTIRLRAAGHGDLVDGLDDFT